MSDSAQRDKALALGNERRLGRASLRREVRDMNCPDGFRRVAELVQEVPPEVAPMMVVDLLTWVYRVQATVAADVLRVANQGQSGPPISEGRLLRDLTGRQREVLSGALVIRAAAIERGHIKAHGQIMAHRREAA